MSTQPRNILSSCITILVVISFFLLALVAGCAGVILLSAMIGGS